MNIKSFSIVLAVTATIGSPYVASAGRYRLTTAESRVAAEHRLAPAQNRLHSGGATGLSRLHLQNTQGRIVNNSLIPLRLRPRHARISTHGNQVTGLLRLLVESRATNRIRQDRYQRLISRDGVDLKQPQSLTVADLRSGVAIGAGWILTIPAVNVVEFRHDTGGFVRYDGDPHLRRRDGFHYGDWTSDHIAIVLPSANANDRCLVYAESTGGDSANGFGLPTRLIAITDDQVINVSNINHENPSGHRTVDAWPTFESLRHRIASAPKYYFDRKSEELRFADGRRPAPPNGAEEYDVHRPSTADDTDTIVRGHVRWRVDAAAATPTLDQEMRLRVQQIAAGQSSPYEDVRRSANALADKLNKYLERMVAYLDARNHLAEKGAEISRRIDKLIETLNIAFRDEARYAELEAQLNELEAAAEKVQKDAADLNVPDKPFGP